MSSWIVCPNCGQKNRIKEGKDNSQAICAKCWTRLGIPERVVQSPPPTETFDTAPERGAEENTKARPKVHRKWLCLLVIMSSWLMAHEICTGTNTNNDRGRQKLPRQQTASEPALQRPEAQLPLSGTTQKTIGLLPWR